MGHRSCDRDLPPIFEPDREASRQVTVRDCRSSALNARRNRKAAGADALFGGLEGHSAAAAAAFAEELDLFPAIGAEAVRVGDDRAAARAARRQGEIQRRSGAIKNKA